MSCSNSEMFTLDFRGTVVLDYTAWECFSGKRVFALNCFSWTNRPIECILPMFIHIRVWSFVQCNQLWTLLFFFFCRIYGSSLVSTLVTSGEHKREGLIFSPGSKQAPCLLCQSNWIIALVLLIYLESPAIYQFEVSIGVYFGRWHAYVWFIFALQYAQFWLLQSFWWLLNCLYYFHGWTTSSASPRRE